MLYCIAVCWFDECLYGVRAHICLLPFLLIPPFFFRVRYRCSCWFTHAWFVCAAAVAVVAFEYIYRYDDILMFVCCADGLYFTWCNMMKLRLKIPNADWYWYLSALIAVSAVDDDNIVSSMTFRMCILIVRFCAFHFENLSILLSRYWMNVLMPRCRPSKCT